MAKKQIYIFSVSWYFIHGIYKNVIHMSQIDTLGFDCLYSAYKIWRNSRFCYHYYYFILWYTCYKLINLSNSVKSMIQNLSQPLQNLGKDTEGKGSMEIKAWGDCGGTYHYVLKSALGTIWFFSLYINKIIIMCIWNMWNLYPLYKQIIHFKINVNNLDETKQKISPKYLTKQTQQKLINTTIHYGSLGLLSKIQG